MRIVRNVIYGFEIVLSFLIVFAVLFALGRRITAWYRRRQCGAQS